MKCETQISFSHCHERLRQNLRTPECTYVQIRGDVPSWLKIVWKFHLHNLKTLETNKPKKLKKKLDT